MMALIRWSLLAVFVTSAATTVFVRSDGYTPVEAEDGRYFVAYKETRHAISRQEFEEARWRYRVNAGAAATMVISLFAFIGLQWARFSGVRRSLR